MITILSRYSDRLMDLPQIWKLLPYHDKSKQVMKVTFLVNEQYVSVIIALHLPIQHS